jgi:hypothetical protein
MGSGWAALDPPGGPLGGPRTAPAPTAALPAEPPSGSLGSPDRSALATYRRRRAEELAGWARSLLWRVPLVAAASLAADVLTSQAGLPYGGLVGLVVAALVGWRLRFRPSEQARTWQRGAEGERRTATRWTAPWRRSAGKPKRSVECSASASTPCCACTAPTFKVAACTPRAWRSWPPTCSATRSA